MNRIELLKRNNLYWVKSQDIEFADISYPRLNIGELVAKEFTRNPPGKHVSLDIDAYLRSTLRHCLSSQDVSPKGVVLDNLGILLEPDLELNPVKLFLELSIDSVVILIWDYAILDGTRFVWDEANPDYGFVFPSQTITNLELPNEVS
jgi:hypothetical protein